MAAGYDPAITDPYEGVRRQMEADAAQSREEAAAAGSQPYQALRKLKSAVALLLQQQAALEQQQQQLAALVQQQASIIASIPVSEIGWGEGGGFNPGGGWNTVASTLIDRPAGKNNVRVLGIGSLSLGFSTSAGGTATWPFLAGRLVIDGVAGPEFGLSTIVQAGDGNVTGSARGTFHFTRGRSGSGHAQVQTQVRITGWANGEASTGWNSQRADVSAFATFEQ